jgi:hypothetical protein
LWPDKRSSSLDLIKDSLGKTGGLCDPSLIVIEVPLIPLAPGAHPSLQALTSIEALFHNNALAITDKKHDMNNDKNL